LLSHLEEKIFSLQEDKAFEEVALELFELHYEKNPVYRRFCESIGIRKQDVLHIETIPCLPVQIFKHYKVVLEGYDEKLVFETSGTTEQRKGYHYIVSPELYRQSALLGFELFYGHPKNYHFLALLPGYLERPNSSLVYMVKMLMEVSGSQESGFFLRDFNSLHEKLKYLQEKKDRTILLLGVTHALIDFFKQYPGDYHDVIIMETGGMKGRGEEWPKFYLHEFIKKQTGVPSVHSEYGMTELLSQAYAKHDGIFSTPPWLKVFLRDPNDLLDRNTQQKRGLIHLIDLVNVYSCPFIATEDIGQWGGEGKFEVLGRLDFSDLRGCSIMAI